MHYRHELKHIINYHDYTFIKLRLKSLLSVDANADSEGSYSVRSLYFDDYFNHAYHDKYAGVLNRAKYRIRMYNQSDQTIHLEKKIKNDQYNQKQTAPMTVEEVYCVLQGDYEFLLRSPCNLLRVFYHECVSNFMRPRVVVDYEREPYTMEAGDVRITFDKNIRAGVGGFDICDATLPMVETLPPELLIMEVKFTEFLPNIVRDILPSQASEYTAVSKYILCCDKTMHQRFSHF
ncbi:MAG TPA: polyphosphate polymerase domain-containing protein [Anaerolineales bacterium]|nr:polyphosphate polymerase domain-containing protein [Anaerolineales bacterium]